MQKEIDGFSNMYTIICSYSGGLYVTQIRTDVNSWEEIFEKWIDKNIVVFELKDKELIKLKSALKDLENMPVLLQGMSNVWCTSVNFKGRLMLFNIVHSLVV